MEQRQLKQFTFYDYYAQILGAVSDDDAGRIARLIGEYMFLGKNVSLPEEDELAYYWNYIESILMESREKEYSGKTAKGLNERMKHFAFHRCYYDAFGKLNDAQVGQFVKSICGYMFEDKSPKLKPPVSIHFVLALHLLDLSKKRKDVGKKGGKAERVPVNSDVVKARQPFGLASIGIDGFLERNPQVRNDIYKNSMHLADGVDWEMLDDMLPDTKWADCTSLYQILAHKKEILGE